MEIPTLGWVVTLIRHRYDFQDTTVQDNTEVKPFSSHDQGKYFLQLSLQYDC
jgi:hypothetical protein